MPRAAATTRPRRGPGTVWAAPGLDTPPRIQIQYESELSTSPRLRVPRDNQVNWPIESLMNRTEPSDRETLTPPGCRLRAEKNPMPVPTPPQAEQSGVLLL